MDSDRVVVPGGHRSTVPGRRVVGLVDPAEPIEVTVVLRRRTEPPAEAFAGRPLSRSQLAAAYGAAPEDLAVVERVLAGAGLEVRAVDAPSRRVRATGPAAAAAELFGVRLERVSAPGAAETFRHRTGELSVPAELGDIVVAVLGLDDRPQARPHLRIARPRAGSASYTPPQLAAAYGFPAADGAGLTVALIELGGGYRDADLRAYFAALGLPAPRVTSVGIDGATNGGGTDPSGSDPEVALDIEVAGAVAPAASLVVYFAPNTDAGFVDAVSAAAHASPAPVAIGVSWGADEDTWTGQARTALDQAIADAALLGVTVTVAAGDSGSSDGAGSGAHVDFPASSPHALGCGGTSLRLSGTRVASETVWNDGSAGGATGGGVSDVFGLPGWQRGVGVPNRAGASGGPAGGRGVPDVAGNADPQTGYRILVDGQQMVVGGTSAVAPLWAGLLARLAQLRGGLLGLVQPQLYGGVRAGVAAPGFDDITAGGNGAYSAGPGWDPCTGLGSPNGAGLLALLGGGGSA